MITQEKLAGNWKQIKGRVKERWGQITDDELNEAEGNYDQLVGLIQQKTGDARAQIEQAIDEFSEGASSLAEKAGAAARNYAGKTAETFRGAAEQIRDQGAESYEGVQEFVRDRPTESVAVAFGVGLILGVTIGVAMGRAMTPR